MIAVESVATGTVVVSSANYTITDGDFNTILVTTGASNRTITLPTAAANIGRQIRILKVDTGVGLVIIDGEGAETIDGATLVHLYSQFQVAALVCDGTEWFLTEPLLYRLDIGDFNMDAGDFVSVTHNMVDHEKVRRITVMIRHDTSATKASDFNGSISGETGTREIFIDATIIRLVRQTGGPFDGTNYDATSYNRGFIEITYLAGG